MYVPIRNYQWIAQAPNWGKWWSKSLYCIQPHWVMGKISEGGVGIPFFWLLGIMKFIYQKGQFGLFILKIPLVLDSKLFDDGHVLLLGLIIIHVLFG